MESWDDEKFLNKAKLLIHGKVTRTAILLLGKEESEHFINPSVMKIRWSLKTHANENKDYALDYVIKAKKYIDYFSSYEKDGSKEESCDSNNL